MKNLLLHMLLCSLISLAACGIRPSISYHIPNTPVGISVPVPLDKLGTPAGGNRTVYIPVSIRTRPKGARVRINDSVVGSTPMVAYVPFKKGLFGDSKGSAQLLVEKSGYLPEGVRVFAIGGGKLSRKPKGKPTPEINLRLRRDR
jgi:hypothetical protein